jgi:hypothetical protein
LGLLLLEAPGRLFGRLDGVVEAGRRPVAQRPTGSPPAASPSG